MGGGLRADQPTHGQLPLDQASGGGDMEVCACRSRGTTPSLSHSPASVAPPSIWPCDMKLCEGIVGWKYVVFESVDR